ncbi:MAG: signal peptidase II [Endomicrobium sp.]|jgi:signal peptidase II|nr:signal peptidase II [Endomicrobium sp.]
MKKPLLIAAVLIILDQISKYLADVFIPYGNFVKIIPLFDFFNLTHIKNTGAAFSMFQGRNFLFTVCIAVFLAALAVWLYKNYLKLSSLQKYAFALILAGGTGNLIDRIFRGAVIDFLDFGINALRWPSFNVADSCVCIAAGIIFADIIKQLKTKNDK